MARVGYLLVDGPGGSARRAHPNSSQEAAKRQPTLQLAGRPDRANVDLHTLQALGVTLTGRIAAVNGTKINFTEDLPAVVAAAQTRLERVLARIDAPAGIERDHLRPDEIARVDVSKAAPQSLAVDADNICTVVWSTGYRRSFPWLRVPARSGSMATLHPRRRHRCTGTVCTWISAAAQARLPFHRRVRLRRGRARTAHLGPSAPVCNSCRIGAGKLMLQVSAFEPHYASVIVGARSPGQRLRCCWQGQGNGSSRSTASPMGPTRCPLTR